MKVIDWPMPPAENTKSKLNKKNGDRSRRVAQFAMDGTYLCTWDSLTEAARVVNRSKSALTIACQRGLSRACGGSRWKYADAFEVDPEEEWRPVAHPVIKAVSSKGRVKTKTGVLTYGSPMAGYLSAAGTLVHRFVAAAFVPNPDNKPYVNHKDSYPHNNAASNLEWVTPSENTQHAHDTGCYRPAAHLETEAVASVADPKMDGLIDDLLKLWDA